MDKILSARIDESVADRIGSLARRLHTSKKNIIESAIEMYAAKIDEEQQFDVLDQTFGAWSDREESTEEIIEQVRKTFRDSFERYQR